MADEPPSYGPALPPSLTSRNSANTDNSDSSEIDGPTLSAVKSLETDESREKLSFGPLPPPRLTTNADHSSDDENGAFGPALPPKLSHKITKSSEAKERVLGPTLPPGYQRPVDDESDDSACESDDFVGPLPPDKVSAASLALEERALELKLSQLSQNSKVDTPEQREEWMLVPPEVVVRSGIAKTQFSSSKCERNRDTSGWTETPQDKKRKAEGQVSKTDQKRKLKDDAERLSIKKRDAEQEAYAKKLKKQHKREKSLLDLHHEKKKKEKDSKPADQGRKPFNREIDLQLNKLNSKQLKSVIDKAKILDSRFSSGSNKYL